MQSLRTYVLSFLLLVSGGASKASVPHAIELKIDPHIAADPLAAFSCTKPPIEEGLKRSVWWLQDSGALRGVPAGLVDPNESRQRFSEAAKALQGLPELHVLFFPYLAALDPASDPGPEFIEIAPGHVHLECGGSIHRRSGGPLPLRGLFLLNEGRVQARILGFPGGLPRSGDSREMVLRAVRGLLYEFIANGRVSKAPLPFRDPGFAPPEGGTFPPGPLLLLSLSGAEARKYGRWDSNRVRWEEHLDDRDFLTKSFALGGGKLEAFYRFVIEFLTPELKKRNIRALGLVESSEKIAELKRAFPYWNFLPRYPRKDPLHFYELTGLAWLYDGEGRSWTLAILPGPGLPGSRPLTDFLKGIRP